MIKLENYYYKYSNNEKVFNNLNLTIEKNKIIAIIGTNGSGKTTLAHILSGIFVSKRGKFSIDDLLVTSKTCVKQLRKKIGIVFQNPDNSIIFNSVYNDMEFTLKNLNFPNGEISKKIEDSLRLVNMDEYIYSNPYELSLGQKQRIAIANTIGIDSEYIVLDEVTAMLDSSMKQEIYKIILDLKEKGKTIIMTTNILDELLIADTIILLEKNKDPIIINREQLIDNLELLKEKGFYIPLVLKLLKILKEKNIEIGKISEIEILDIINSKL